jgi:hypothetical protein
MRERLAWSSVTLCAARRAYSGPNSLKEFAAATRANPSSVFQAAEASAGKGAARRFGKAPLLLELSGDQSHFRQTL